MELNFPSNLSRFDANPREHYHFMCVNCGCIFDLDEPVDRNIESRVIRETGFKVLTHRLELRGLCRDCQ